MTAPKYINLAKGKPRLQKSYEVLGDTLLADTVDLLWPYQFQWLTIDRWGPKRVDVAVAGSKVNLPDVTLEISRDGIKFDEVIPSYGIVSSDLGSKGSHRSIRLIFPETYLARFIRITYLSGDWRYLVRASLTEAEVVSQEKSKFIEPLPADYQNSRLRAIVLGDSNSVMRQGWVQGLPAGGIDVLENVSLGSSSNAIHATQIHRITEVDTDLLFVQTNVNEYIPIRDRAYDAELSRQMIRHTLAWAHQHNVIPVYVIQPHRRGLDDLLAGRVAFDQESYLIEQCEDLGIPYVNGFELLRSLSVAWGRPLRSFFKDAAHLAHPIAQILGAAIASGSIKWMLENHKLIKKSNPQLIHSFQVIDIAREMADGSASERRIKTSLVDQNMVTIQGSTKLNVPVEEGWEVVAFTMNARNSNASVQLSGQNTVVRRADFAGFQGKDGFPFVCVRSLMHPIAPSEGSVTLSVTPPLPSHEPDEISNKKIPMLSLEDSVTEISQLVLRSLERSDTYQRILGVDLNVTESITMSSFTNV